MRKIIATLAELYPLIHELDNANDDCASDSSVDSDDEEFGITTLTSKVTNTFDTTMRTISTEVLMKSDDVEVSLTDIETSPGKYFIANFRGDSYGPNFIPNHPARRRHVKAAVNDTYSGRPNAYNSQLLYGEAKVVAGARRPLETRIKGLLGSFSEGTPLFSAKKIQSYKNPSSCKKAIEAAGDKKGNPYISTTKTPETAYRYGSSSLNPKYADKKPKHRLLGLTTVFFTEANTYVAAPKADVQTLGLTGKSAVEWDNEEVMFLGKINKEHVAARIPISVPNFNQINTEKYQKFYGFGANFKKRAPKGETLSDKTKKETTMLAHAQIAWGVAETAVRRKGNDCELLYVDHAGKFKKVSWFKTQAQLNERDHW